MPAVLLRACLLRKRSLESLHNLQYLQMCRCPESIHQSCPSFPSQQSCHTHPLCRSPAMHRDFRKLCTRGHSETDSLQCSQRWGCIGCLQKYAQPQACLWPRLQCRRSSFRLTVLRKPVKESFCKRWSADARNLPQIRLMSHSHIVCSPR